MLLAGRLSVQILAVLSALGLGAAKSRSPFLDGVRPMSNDDEDTLMTGGGDGIMTTEAQKPQVLETPGNTMQFRPQANARPAAISSPEPQKVGLKMNTQDAATIHANANAVQYEEEALQVVDRVTEAAQIPPPLPSKIRDTPKKEKSYEEFSRNFGDVEELNPNPRLEAPPQQAAAAFTGNPQDPQKTGVTMTDPTPKLRRTGAIYRNTLPKMTYTAPGLMMH